MTIDEAYRLATELHRSGRAAEAEQFYRKILFLQPDHADVNANLGMSLLSAGRAEEAIIFLQRAISLRPRDANSIQNLGVALLQLNRNEEAVENFRVAVSISGSDARFHNNLGIALGRVYRFDEAVEHHRRALALSPDFAKAYVGLGAALWNCGTIDEAIECDRRALALQPGFDLALANLAESLANIGRFDEAETYYRQLAALRPVPTAARNAGTGRTQPDEIFVVCSIRNGGLDLLPHWLDHYSKFNPDRILLGVFDDVSPEARAEIDHFSGQWQFKTFRLTWVGTSELEQQEQCRAACRAAGATDRTWVIYADLDELHEYPLPPPQLITHAESLGVEAIYGWLLDRVAADGSLPKIPSFGDSTSASLWDVFPLGCRLTGIVLRSASRKVMMARLHLPIGAGHHAAGNVLPHPIPYGRISQYVLHHFKWHQDAVARLQWGLNHAGRNPLWQSESRRFLSWLDANGGKINLNDASTAIVRRGL